MIKNKIALLTLLYLLLPVALFAYDLTNEGYDAPINPFDQWEDSWYECTRYAFGRTYEKTGVTLTFSQSDGRHGGRWYDLVEDLPRGSEPLSNSLAVWDYGTYGHVAFVEDVQDNNVTITEANWANPTDGIVRGPYSLTKDEMEQRGNYTLIGYIYLGYVYDFWRRADPIVASNQNGTINFDAQYKVRNTKQSTITIDNMAIDIINQNDTRFAMWVKNSSTTLSPGESYSTGIQYEELWYSGNYSVEARLQIDGVWATHAKIDFQVVDQQTSFPDLVVESPSVDDNTLTPNEDFKIFATVRNAGNGSSAATTLRYYLSNNSTISTSDSEIGTDTVDPLSAGASSPEDKSGREAPSSPGTYWVGACVDAVSGESNTGNNCSAGVQITVTDDPPASQEPVGYFDSADCNGLSGWTKDPDTTAAIDVHFYADGPVGTGTFIGGISADVYRGDLPYDDKNHGFSFAFPDSLNDGLEHQVYGYAIDSNGGENPLLTHSPKTVQCGLTPEQLAAVMSVIDNIIFSDIDGDGIFDDVDNCPNVSNADQSNYDNDSSGDACDDDDDNDGVTDVDDAFPFDSTESQDFDGDGIGDNADTDDDNDGVADVDDAFPFDPTETKDSDGDGIGDNADPDDNNNGIPDDQEGRNGFLPAMLMLLLN